nr:hypothetical protein CFP56_62207 [Quercus suber]
MGEGRSNNEDAEPSCAIDVLVLQKVLQQRKRRPDRFPVDHGTGRGDNDADEAGHRETDGDSEELRPQRVIWSACETREIWVVHYQSRKVGNGGHDAFDDGPGQSTSDCGRFLVYDRADSICTHDSPDEKGDTSRWDKVCLDSEQMADLMHWEPQEWERTQPEEEERHEVSSVGAGGERHGVFGSIVTVLIPGRPDCSDHKIDAGTADPSLDTIPDTRHTRSVEHRPERTPDTERAARDDGKADVGIFGIGGDARAGDHPGVDVKTVGNPKGDKIARAPLPSLWLDRFEIVVRQHKLGVGQSWLALDGKLVEDASDSGGSDFLHGDVECAERKEDICWRKMISLRLRVIPARCGTSKYGCVESCPSTEEDVATC